MNEISGLERAESLDKAAEIGQRVARLIRPGRVRSGLNGTWLGHSVHQLLVQAATGSWLSATIVDVALGDEAAARGLSAFRIADGSVAQGLATAPQPAFDTRIAGGTVQVRLPVPG